MFAPAPLTELFEKFNNLHVLIVGDVMVDAYVWGRASRLSPEAPVPVVNVERTEQRPLIMNAVPFPGDGEDGPHSVLLLIDLDATPALNCGALKQVFGLTPTEAKLATLMAKGATLTEAAALQGVRVATVRAQLRAIFTKTHTHRQAELVMLVSRLSTLS